MVSTTGELTAAEAALLDVAGLVTRGQADEVPRRLRRMLSGKGVRRPDGLSEACRGLLRELLQNADNPGARRRARSAGTATPVRREEVVRTTDDLVPPTHGVA